MGKGVQIPADGCRCVQMAAGRRDGDAGSSFAKATEDGWVKRETRASPRVSAIGAEGAQKTLEVKFGVIL
jgi:hypothetical protein